MAKAVGWSWHRAAVVDEVSVWCAIAYFMWVRAVGCTDTISLREPPRLQRFDLWWQITSLDANLGWAFAEFSGLSSKRTCLLLVCWSKESIGQATVDLLSVWARMIDGYTKTQSMKTGGGPPTSLLFPKLISAHPSSAQLQDMASGLNACITQPQFQG
jgi:hypothetical protein